MKNIKHITNTFKVFFNRLGIIAKVNPWVG